ncbi:MAG: formate/nitrite transporter family protein [Planctomycetes bacterium]|jgi:formate/nitrite transporter FocA (FNT family)|nr:formate/nitrite transporter family protein [Planctomycetota bacterium]
MEQTSHDPNRLIVPESGEDAQTQRGQERQHEDQHYVPVIVKRTDESRRHPDDILQTAINEGLLQYKRGVISLLLSSIAAGLVLGFTAMAVATMTVAFGDAEPLRLRVAQAVVYPIGFIICIMASTELFTEHTATAVYPALDRRVGPLALLRVWTVVLIGNLMGAIASAGLLAMAEPVVGAAEGYRQVGQHLVSFGFWPLLGSAILAGWLMALGAWLILATPPMVSQMVAIYIVTFAIGIGGLHHSIAGAVEAFAAIFIGGGVNWPEAARFIGIAILGNLIGGSLFVAVLNYAHIRKAEQVEG